MLYGDSTEGNFQKDKRTNYTNNLIYLAVQILNVHSQK